jgi:squalene-hopene/tetraprenyl-beta-curcumene cyclase
VRKVAGELLYCVLKALMETDSVVSWVHLLTAIPAMSAAFSMSAAEGSPLVKPERSPDISFRHEIQHAIDQGLSFLLASQNSNGWWSTADHPALTALALTAFMGEPTDRYRPPPRAISNGFAYLVASVKPDGTIYRTALINYNTSISMMALVAARNPAYDDILRRARASLIKAQLDLGTPGQVDSPADGGFGYGDNDKSADLNNTLTVLEAMYYTRHLVRDRPAARDLNWAAALRFIQNCQNLSDPKKQGAVSEDPKDRGGFVYAPSAAPPAAAKPPPGRSPLRSYGSISYAGLLSFIYADLPRNDLRVTAVLDWLRSNYTLQENPGVGDEGFYYYLHLLSKGLAAAQVDQLELKDGRTVDWRHETTMCLINLQRRDGSWVNTNGRWWEKDPNLVTAYSVIALEIIYRGI